MQWTQNHCMTRWLQRILRWQRNGHWLMWGVCSRSCCPIRFIGCQHTWCMPTTWPRMTRSCRSEWGCGWPVQLHNSEMRSEASSVSSLRTKTSENLVLWCTMELLDASTHSLDAAWNLGLKWLHVCFNPHECCIDWPNWAILLWNAMISDPRLNWQKIAAWACTPQSRAFRP